MSWKKWNKLPALASSLGGLFGGRSSQEPIGRGRRLMIDPLEERQLLTVATGHLDDQLVNQTNYADEVYDSQTTIAGQSAAVDNDGDFVAVWTRTETIYDSLGNPVVDPATGAIMTDSNVYARYFTDEVQRLTMPTGVLADSLANQYGQMTLRYGGNEVQRLTITAGQEPFTSFPDTISGDIELGYDVDGSGTVDAGETVTIAYDETDELPDIVDAIQTGLQSLGGALADVEVKAIDHLRFDIRFGAASAGEDVPLITVESSNFVTGFQPDAEVTVVREPVEITGIFISPDNPYDTATSIEQAFIQLTEGYEIAPWEIPVPQFGADVVRTPIPRVSVTPVFTTVDGEELVTFDITFIDDSGKINHPELVVTELLAEDGTDLTAGASVTTLKQSSDEFRVNAPEVDNPFTPQPDKFDQSAPAVVMDSDGEFIIVWQGEVPDNVNFGSKMDIFARRFSGRMMVDPGDVSYYSDNDNDGVAETPIQGIQAIGDEFRVNDFTTEAQLAPSIDMDDESNFTISWSNQGQDISFFNGIVAQRFDSNGGRVGSEFLVNDEDTEIHSDSYVSLSADGYAMVTWNIGPTIYGEVYDPDGNVLEEQFVVGTGAGSTSAWDMDHNVIVGWSQLADTDNTGGVSTGVYATEYSVEMTDGAFTSFDVIREPFRINSASTNTDSNTNWPLAQFGAQVAIDADGDLVVTYEGYGKDVAEDDVDQLIEQQLIFLAAGGATEEELAQARVDLEATLGYIRGAANDVLWSRFDADPLLGDINILASDNVGNNYRDGHNTRYMIAIDELTADGSFTVEVNGQPVTINVVPADGGVLNAGDTAGAIEAALEAAAVTGVYWPEAQFFDGPISVRLVPAFEIILRQGTDWELPGVLDTDYVFEVVFQGETHDRPMSLVLTANNLVQPDEEVAEEQQLSFAGAADMSGYYSLQIGDDRTNDLFWPDLTQPGNSIDDVAAAIRTAIQGLGYNGVTVTAQPGGPPYVFDVVFGGDSTGENIDIIQFLPPENEANQENQLEATFGATEVTEGATNTPEAPPPTLLPYATGVEGTTQTAASIGLEPDGDMVMVWTQNELGTDGFLATNDNIYYRTFNETTDTFGPQVTGLHAGDGSLITRGGDVVIGDDGLQYLVVTFDEEMLARGPYSLTNPDYYTITLDGTELDGAVAEVYFGMNKSADLADELGITPLRVNKWEAVLVLDGNGGLEGTPALEKGEYQLTLSNQVRDKSGNNLGRSGFDPDGSPYVHSFEVLVTQGDDSGVGDPGGGGGGDEGDQSFRPESGSQHAPQAVASDADGERVIVWTNDAAGSEGIYARVFNDLRWTNDDFQRVASGPVPGDAILVTDNDSATFASVDRDGDGDFVVTWTQNDGNGSTDWNVYARRYDAVGNALGEAFMVNTETYSAQRFSSVAMDIDGDFVITWESLGQDGSGYGIYAQRYNADGERVGGSNEIQTLEIVGTPSGTFTLSWDVDNDSSTPRVTTAAIEATENTSLLAERVQAALDAIDGGINEVEVRPIDLSRVGIFFTGAGSARDQAQITVASQNFTSGSAAIVASTEVEGHTGEFRVNDTTQGNQTWAAIDMDADGNFIVTWTGETSPSDTDIFAKRFVSNDAYRFGTDRPGQDGRVTQRNTDARWAVTTDDPDNHIVNPGAGYDGVILTANGGSGVLLETGRHIITAAHVVDSGDGTPIDSIDIVFDLPGGPTTITATQIFIHSGWTGDIFDGNDMAMIVLPYEAPPQAERYGIYRGTNPLNQVVDFVGYGTQGQGAEEDYDGLKRRESNVFEYYGDQLNGLPMADFFGGTGTFDFPEQSVLIYDFDSGLPENDAFGLLFGKHDLGLGEEEGSASHGDSGGAAFLNGLLVGVTSGGVEYVNADSDDIPFNVSYGTIGMYGSTAYHAEWIDLLTSSTSGEFTVNDTTTGIQKWSDVAMDADGDFVITWTSVGQDGDDEGVFAKRYNADGSEFVDPAGEPEIDPDTGEPVLDPDTGEPVIIFNPLGEFQVNTFTDSSQQRSKVDMDADGDFMIVWESFQDLPNLGNNDPLGSFGIYAQRYAANHKLDPDDPFSTYGTYGEIGDEVAINGHKGDDQRFPSVALDDTGDWVVVWAGAGPGDEQGIFQRQFFLEEDDAGPTVTDIDAVLGTTGAPDLERVTDGAQFEQSFGYLLVRFGENLNVTDANAYEAVTNPANWELTRNGEILRGGVSQVQFGLNLATAFGLAAGPTNKYEALVELDGDPDTAGVQPLGPGSYELSLRDRVEDLFGNQLDGDYDGTPGDRFSRSFVVLGGNSTGEVGAPGTPDAGADDDDLLVNYNETTDQDDPAVAVDVEGNYVVVWASQNPGTEEDPGNILAQRYNRFGEKLGGEIIVNSYRTGLQIDPDVAMDQYGNFVVTWSGEGEDDDEGIWARVFSNSGTPLDEQFRVNQERDHTQEMSTIATDRYGNFVVTWTSEAQEEQGVAPNRDLTGVYARRFTLAGVARGDEFQVNTETINRQENSDIAMTDDGRFVIVWASDGQDGSDWGIYGQRFNANGTKAGGEFRVNTFTDDKQVTPRVAMDAAGNFVVAWASFSNESVSNEYRSGYDIFARRYAASGAARDGSEFRVNEEHEHWQIAPTVSMADNGDFVISWASFSQDRDRLVDPRDYGVYARRYAADGSVLPPDEFRVNATTIGDQTTPDVAVDPDGDFVVVWAGPDDNGTGVYQRRMNIHTTSSETWVGGDPVATNVAPQLGVLNGLALQREGSGSVQLQYNDADGDPLTVLTMVTSQAYSLDQQLDLGLHNNNDYFNYRGLNEKYLYSASSNTWYYILPNGEFYRWRGSIASSTLLTTLDAAVWENPELLYNAQPTLQLQSLDQQLDLGLDNGKDYFNYRGLNEKYLYSASSKTWYYILPNGELYQWRGSIETSILLAKLTPEVWGNLASLYDPGSDALAALDQQLDLGLDKGRDYFNYRGLNEKYLFSASTKTWYYILPNGELYQWRGSIENSILFAKLTPEVWGNLASLYDPGSNDLAALDQQLDLGLDKGRDYFNYRGLNEKYLYSASSKTWYYILPNGDFYQWGGSIAASTLLTNVGSDVWRNPGLLYNAPQTVAAASNGAMPIELSLDKSTGQLDVTAQPGAVGTYSVTVQVSDGVALATGSFDVDIQNTAPELAAIDDVTLPRSTGNATVQLDYSDADGDTLTTSVSVSTALYELDQSLQLNKSSSGYFFNHRGLNEKYLVTPNNRWYYLLPNGDMYRWGGSIANSSLLTTLDPEVWADPTLLHAATKPDASVIQLAIDEATKQLTIDLDTSFEGELDVTVQVSDGAVAVREEFRVALEEATQAGSLLDDDLLDTLANG